MVKKLVEESSEVKEEGRMKKTRPEETETGQKRPEELAYYVWCQPGVLRSVEGQWGIQTGLLYGVGG